MAPPTSRALATLRVPAKRQTLTQQIEDWSAQGNGINIETFDRIEEIWSSSKGYLFAALSTQSQQEKFLFEYRKWTALYLASVGQDGALILDPDAPEDVNDGPLFPKDASKQLEFACRVFDRGRLDGDDFSQS
ncbi:hypothetical protein W97_03724 [Coniosporium apollinis CBS 100218]|uniref:Uncharacterized protein n=1 Tax=Coniosporium apollinis (strain CBS 100218) TaxID=1168221 RepID=R7YRF6_CONA1|nr:uncharacterized protein W97_03724 [Coniosporium apollinis CBS 100218]EON64492.1 hypothetical protein W97_03724 [Coniosporium apollinis CBS 100218]